MRFLFEISDRLRKRSEMEGGREEEGLAEVTPSFDGRALQELSRRHNSIWSQQSPLEPANLMRLAARVAMLHDVGTASCINFTLLEGRDFIIHTPWR